MTFEKLELQKRKLSVALGFVPMEFDEAVARLRKEGWPQEALKNMKIKRFLLFAYEEVDYPMGAWYDFMKSYDTFDEAATDAIRVINTPDVEYKWWQIVDLDTGVVYRHHWSNDQNNRFGFKEDTDILDWSDLKRKFFSDEI